MGFKPDLDDQLVSFSALTLLVWSSGLSKIVPEMTYYVSSGTLNPAQSFQDIIDIMKGRPTRGRRRLQMLHVLANDGYVE